MEVLTSTWSRPRSEPTPQRLKNGGAVSGARVTRTLVNPRPRLRHCLQAPKRLFLGQQEGSERPKSSLRSGVQSGHQSLQSRMNRAIARQSSPIVAFVETSLSRRRSRVRVPSLPLYSPAAPVRPPSLRAGPLDNQGKSPDERAAPNNEATHVAHLRDRPGSHGYPQRDHPLERSGALVGSPDSLHARVLGAFVAVGIPILVKGKWSRTSR